MWPGDNRLNILHLKEVILPHIKLLREANQSDRKFKHKTGAPASPPPGPAPKNNAPGADKCKEAPPANSCRPEGQSTLMEQWECRQMGGKLAAEWTLRQFLVLTCYALMTFNVWMLLAAHSIPLEVGGGAEFERWICRMTFVYFVAMACNEWFMYITGDESWGKIVSENLVKGHLILAVGKGMVWFFEPGWP